MKIRVIAPAVRNANKWDDRLAECPDTRDRTEFTAAPANPALLVAHAPRLCHARRDALPLRPWILAFAGRPPPPTIWCVNVSLAVHGQVRGGIGGHAVANSLGWLREPDHFDWVSAYIVQRGLLPRMRVIMVVVTASSALAPLSTLLRPSASAAIVAIGICGAALALALTVVWIFWWPTRQVSLCCALTGTVCAAGWSLSQSSTMLAAVTGMVLAVTGAYIAFFHSAAALLANTVVAVAVYAVIGHQIAGEIDLATALAVFWLGWLITIVLPLSVRALAHAMRQYAIRAEHDALTGLLNRAGFDATLGRSMAGPWSSHTTGHLVVMMIDLDDFKGLNDSRGHAAGDDVLRMVAELLRTHAPSEAAVCRAGGEEFLIAYHSPTADVADAATRLCRAIHRSCDGVTASIGITVTPATSLLWPAGIDHLVESADGAMYDAKRRGGNRVHLATTATAVDIPGCSQP